jgi:transposase
MAENRQFGDIITGNRMKNHQFNNDSRAAMIALRHGGMSYGKLATQFGTDKSTIYRICKRWEIDHKTTPRPRIGAPNKLSESDITYLNLQVKKNRYVKMYDVQKQAEYLGISVHLSTIAKVMRATWGRKWRRRKRILLSKASAKRRLRFALEWLPKIEELKKVWPSIEPLF